MAKDFEPNDYVLEFPATLVNRFDVTRKALFRLAIKWLSELSSYERSMEDLKSKLEQHEAMDPR